jgi:hypothetical protein
MRKRDITTSPSVWVVRVHPYNNKELSREDRRFFADKARKTFRFYKTESEAKRAMNRNKNYFNGVELEVYEQFWLVFK